MEGVLSCCGQFSVHRVLSIDQFPSSQFSSSLLLYFADTVLYYGVFDLINE